MATVKNQGREMSRMNGLLVLVSTHARYDVARICIPAGWLRWWRLFVDQWVPKRKPGRPVMEVVDST